MDEEVFTFGSFRLIPGQRMLSEDGKPVRIGGRALDILALLTGRAGETISKEELIARAWPGTVVEEAALRVHVAALRKALGDGRAGRRYIANLSGRGYAFIAPVTRETAPSATAAPTAMAEAGNLPALLTRIVGRDDVISRLAQQLLRRRFITIVGPGGIGKTTVAVAVADVVRGSYSDGGWYVELASLSDPDLVTSAVGAALGVPPSGGDHMQALVAWLRDRNALLVLDNCEHVISAAAVFAETILKAARQAGILATSREPLRAEGEWLHRLAPLELPPQEKTSPTAAESLGYSAVELFNERATATADSFVLDDAEVPAVLEICRRLDGMPLALELAAARVDTFGVRELAARLDDRFGVLTSGRRTALPRQQTLRATIDWSYQLLPESEQVILRRLAHFRGAFTIDAAVAVAVDDRITVSAAIEGVANLARKSLITTDITGNIGHHRLLETPRTYALEKLTQSDELPAVARRHAKYYLDLFERAETEWETRPPPELLVDYGWCIDNLRAALDWAFSLGGDAAIGVALTAAGAPLWIQLSLLEECSERVERALASIHTASATTARQHMYLTAALATSLFHTKGAVGQVETAWVDTLELAEQFEESDYQLRALWGLWSYSISAGDYQGADKLSRRFHQIAERSKHTGDLLIAERMIGATLHFLGDQEAARHHIEAMLAQYEESHHHPHIARFHHDQRLAAQVTLARILWAQGFPEQAKRTAATAVAAARATRHPISLCFALNEAAIMVALFTGDWLSAERYIETLRKTSEQHALAVLHARAIGAMGVLAAKRGDPNKAVELIRNALHELDKSGHHAYPLLLGSLAETLGAVGDVEEGLASVQFALSRCERNGERWYLADLLRIKGELTLRSSDAEAAIRAETEFLSSLNCARQQGALAWELRAATSMARLLYGQGRSADAIGILQPVYDRFTEGFETADLKSARALIETLRPT